MRRCALTTFLIFSAVAGMAIHGQAQTPSAPKPMVRVTEAKMINTNPAQKYIGHVETISSVKLKPRVKGYLEKVNFDEGSYVQQGERLYVIEQPPYEAAVASAKARVVQMEAELFKATKHLERMQSADPESIPATKLDDAKAAKDLAEGRLQEAKANLKRARIDLDYTTIEAPISGRIGKSAYKQGDLVGPSSGQLAEIFRMDPIRVVFSVSENQVNIIRRALQNRDSKEEKRILQVNIKIPNGSAYPRTGIIDFIDNQVDSGTGTIAVWAKFDNPDHELLPGAYVNVFPRLKEPDMEPAVPQVAVQQDKKGRFVYVVTNNNTVDKRRITTGKGTADKLVIKSGISKGEKVITRGIQKVKPGSKVKIENDNKDNK